MQTYSSGNIKLDMIWPILTNYQVRTTAKNSLLTYNFRIHPGRRACKADSRHFPTTDKILIGRLHCHWSDHFGDLLHKWRYEWTNNHSRSIIHCFNWRKESEIPDILFVLAQDKFRLLHFRFHSQYFWSPKGILFQSIKGTQDGRIFLAGRDGCLHEVIYSAEKGTSNYQYGDVS